MARCGSGHLYCRVADRGNIGGALDLFDREVEQPQRLVWLTPGLGAVDRVKRLQHLVPGLGLVSSSALEETKRAEPVWDESTGDEEYLTNGDSIYDSQPVYDEYADEEWYSLFIRGDRNLSGEMLVEGGDRLGGDGIGVATVGDFPNLKVPIFQPPNTESLNFELYKVGCKLSMHEAITCGPVMLIEQLNENMAMHMRVVKNLNCDVPQANNLRKSNSNGSIMNTVGKVKLFMEVMMIIMKGNHVDVPFDPGVVDNFLVSGIKMARTCPIISRIFFVDDSSFFFKANRAECQNLLNILARYCSASGQNINFVKSSTLFSPNCPEDLQQQLCDLLNVQRMDLKARYLGLPSVIGRNKNELFSFILDKVLHKMQGWKQKLLSQAGREVLIKSVIQAIPSYAMQCYLLPKGFLDKLLTHIRRFFWHGDAHGKHIHWLRWDRLSKPKDEGGAWLVWDLTLLGYGKVSSTVEMFSFKVSDGRILTSFAIERKGDDSRFVIFQSYRKGKRGKLEIEQEEKKYKLLGTLNFTLYA
ncbi:hypothetical protein Tco_0675677, partial [Tanacetum coccineum]